MKNKENRDSKDEFSSREQPVESQLTFHPKERRRKPFSRDSSVSKRVRNMNDTGLTPRQQRKRPA